MKLSIIEINSLMKISAIKKLRTIACLMLVLVFFANKSEAQQDPMYTQYNFNMQTVNPAYAGTWGRLGVMALGRYQWVGMEGYPHTYTFSMQAPTRFEKVGLGLNVIADKVGKEKRLTFSGDYSYMLHFSKNIQLRLGLKGGLTCYSNPLTDYDGYPEAGDEVYNADIENKYIPNFGIGAFLYSDDFYVGFSVPKILQNDLTDGGVNYSSYSEMRHFFFSAGYVFELGQNLDFKPTMFTKVVKGSPVQVDLSANFLISNTVWLGAMCRISESYGFVAQFVIGEHSRLGYAIDFSPGKLKKVQDGTHELMISYEFGSRKKWDSPRKY